MKRLMLAIAISGMLGAPVFAQETPGGETPQETPQEALARLHKLMKQASDEMNALERELAKASLASPKADVLNERIRKLREAMQQGKLDEMPEGLTEHIRENPDDVARETGKSTDEIRKIAESEKQLRELLEKNPELLKKLAESEDTMQRVLEKQQAVERRLADTLRKQEQAAEAARAQVDESIRVAHSLRQP